MIDWNSLQLVIWFGLGVVFQSLILIRGKMDPAQLLALLLISLIVGTRGSTFREVVLFYFATFAFFFGGFFRKILLIRVDEETIFFYTLLLWFSIGQSDLQLSYKIFFFGAVFVPTATTLLNAAMRLNLTRRYKLWLYVWYLIVSSLLVILSVFGGRLDFLLSTNNQIEVNSWPTFFAGMAFLILAINFWYVVLLIPSDRTAESHREQQEHENEVVGSYLDKESSFPRVLVLTLFVSLVFIVNRLYMSASEASVTSLLVILYANKGLFSGLKGVLK